MVIWLVVCSVLLGLLPFVIEGAVIGNGNECVYNGITYQEGERVNKSPCSPCTCTHGRMMCMAIDCAPPMCVNPVRKPNQCCQNCPDGNNCKYKDVVIKSGDTYRPDASTVCSCSTHFSYLFGPHGHEALCVHKATDVTSTA